MDDHHPLTFEKSDIKTFSFNVNLVLSGQNGSYGQRIYVHLKLVKIASLTMEIEQKVHFPNSSASSSSSSCFCCSVYDPLSQNCKSETLHTGWVP